MRTSQPAPAPSPIMDDTPTIEAVLADIWARLGRARNDRKSEWRWFTVATVARDGAARARTVVLRDVAPCERRLDFHTDRRSAKIAELLADPRVALHFLDRRAAMQVRMRGRATILDDAGAAAIWSRLPEAARANYEQAAAPGTDLAPGDAPTARAAAPTNARQNFAVVQIAVADIDWLHLRSSGHRRASFRLVDCRWSGSWITP